MCDCTYLSATRRENLGLERSSGNAGVDPMIYSEAGTCGNGSLPWTPRKTGRNKSPFLPFIPSEAGGFLNSPARTDVPAQTSAGGKSFSHHPTTETEPRKNPRDKDEGSRGSSRLWNAEPVHTYQKRTQQIP